MSDVSSLDTAIEISTIFVVCDRVMNKASELRIAKRMARLGTETAFEVLVKARALEAKGRDIVHLEIGRILILRATLSRRPRMRCTKASLTTDLRPACRSCARPSLST